MPSREDAILKPENTMKIYEKTIPYDEKIYKKYKNILRNVSK